MSICDLLYNPNFSLLINQAGISLLPGQECNCDDMYHWCSDHPTAYMWKILVRIVGNPVKMTPEQADYEVHFWYKNVVLPSRFYNEAEILATVNDELTDEDLMTQFTVSATQDIRDIETMHKPNLDKINAITKTKFVVNPGNVQVCSGKNKDAYFKQFDTIVKAVIRGVTPREQSEITYGKGKLGKKGKR